MLSLVPTSEFEAVSSPDLGISGTQQQQQQPARKLIARFLVHKILVFFSILSFYLAAFKIFFFFLPLDFKFYYDVCRYGFYWISLFGFIGFVQFYCLTSFISVIISSNSVSFSLSCSPSGTPITRYTFHMMPYMSATYFPEMSILFPEFHSEQF